MTEDRSVSLTLTWAWAAWAWTGILFAVAVVAYFADGGRLAILIAEGACIVSAVAATMHIKHFGHKVCDVIRDRDELSADIRRLSSSR